MRSREHIPELDGLRAIACLLVLWIHIGTDSFAPPSIIQAGSTGVDLFFVLSGFLITRILLFNRLNNVSLGSFWVRRSARIFPVAWIGLAISMAIRPSFELIFPALYIQNFGAICDWSRNVICTHYWSLAIEEQFYLVLPPVIYLSRRSSIPNRIWLMCALFLLSIFVVPILWPDLDKKTLDLAITNGTTTRGWLLMAGAVIGLHERNIRGKRSTSLMLSAVCIGVTFILPHVFAVTATLAPSQGWSGLIMLSRQLMVIALFLLCLGFEGHACTSLLRSRILRYIGARSYGLYVYHLMIYDMFGVRKFYVTSSTDWNVLLAIAVTFALAELSYRYVERPFLEFAAKRWRPPSSVGERSSN